MIGMNPSHLSSGPSCYKSMSISFERGEPNRIALSSSPQRSRIFTRSSFQVFWGIKTFSQLPFAGFSLLSLTFEGSLDFLPMAAAVDDWYCVSVSFFHPSLYGDTMEGTRFTWWWFLIVEAYKSKSMRPAGDIRQFLQSQLAPSNPKLTHSTPMSLVRSFVRLLAPWMAGLCLLLLQFGSVSTNKFYCVPWFHHYMTFNYGSCEPWPPLGPKSTGIESLRAAGIHARYSRSSYAHFSIAPASLNSTNQPSVHPNCESWAARLTCLGEIDYDRLDLRSNFPSTGAAKYTKHQQTNSMTTRAAAATCRLLSFQLHLPEFISNLQR